FAVADGMGGHQAGEVASELAARTLRERLHAGASSVDVVVAAVLEANAAIFQTAHTNAEQRGMGTTLTAITVLPANDERGEQLALVNVGDSRAYLLRSGELTRATVDHSYVQELLATGHITENEARNHPRRNIVTRALGIEPTVRVDSWLLPIVRGDRYVICSDGLVDEVEDFDIHTLLDNHPDDPQAAAEALVSAAIASGGRDNVTVVVIDVLDGLELEQLEAALEAGEATVALTRPPVEIDTDPVTSEMPVTEVAPEPTPKARRQLSAGTFMLMLLAAVVLTVVITLIAVAVSGNDDDNPPPTSTTSSTSSTSSTTSSSSTTSTTVARSTTSLPTST
ncbi:MAG: serine/threonine-protein phosphatase, partial [Actinobacteria bacterium]|nr:serine/threonine-protein phosphatase [Actinomycetota bacterium]